METPLAERGEKILPTFKAKQIQALLNFNPERKNAFRLHGLVCLLLDTGLRISEALSLTQEDINWDFTVRVKGKGNKRRLVPFSPELRKLLFRYTHAAGGGFSIVPSQSFLFERPLPPSRREDGSPDVTNQVDGDAEDFTKDWEG